MTGYELGKQIADMQKDSPKHVADSALKLAEAIILEREIAEFASAGQMDAT